MSQTKKQELREKRARQAKQQRLMALIFISLGAIMVAFLLIWPNIKPVGEVKAVELNPRPQQQGNSMGDPNAPVKIVEYSDFQCPYCRIFWEETEHQIVEEYVKTGKVYFTYRTMGNFVSDNINRSTSGTNRESELASMAAYCAGDQNMFWEYHDILFTNWDGENEGAFASKRLEAFAETLGLDMAAFNDCMSSEKHLSTVQTDLDEGSRAIASSPENTDGGVGTPSFFINGKLIQGAQPYEVFKQAIEAALTEAGQ